MFVKIRHWLILTLAGKMQIAINLDFIEGVLYLYGNRGGLVANCYFKHTPTWKERLRAWIRRLVKA